MDDLDKSSKIGIIASPSTNDNPGLTNLIEILSNISENLFVITGNYSPNFKKRFFLKNMKIKNNESIFFKIYNSIKFQLFTIFKLYTLRTKIDTVFFHVGTTLVLPMLISKFLNIKSILIFTGSASESIRKTCNSKVYGFIFYYVVNIMERFNFYLADKIVVYSPNIILNLNLSHNDKIEPDGGIFIDSKLFNYQNPFTKRENIVGYVGRLSTEKGILNFVDALSLIHEKDIQFFIIGKGPLSNEIKDKLDNISKKVKLIDWVPNDELSSYLNNIKLLVIPSYTEAGPQILLEAISCGTPVLSTSVGIVPDVIENKINGFILEDNSPQTIGKSIENIINNENLIEISKNARKTAQEFSLDSAVKRYKYIIRDLNE